MTDEPFDVVDPDELRVRIAEVKRRRSAMEQAAADAEREITAAGMGELDPDTAAALDQAIADNEDFARRRSTGD